MRKVEILSIAILLMAGVAVAGEDVTQSEKNIKENTTHSTTVQENVDQTGQKRHKRTTVKKQRETTTSDNTGADPTTRKRMEVEKKSSTTTTSEGTDADDSPGAVREYHQQSETHHEHTTKEVDKK